jgi:hypothetical protein
MTKYGLHPSGAGQWKDVTLAKPPFPLYQAASKSVGLDLMGHSGVPVRLLIVPLRERSRENTGVRAYFVVDGETVVGAYLVLDGAAPGIVSLADKSELNANTL